MRAEAAPDPRFLTRVGLIAGAGGLLFGYDTGVIGGAQLFIEKEFQLSTMGTSLLVSMVLLGALVGAAAAGWVSDRFGRKKTLLFAALLFTASSLAAAAAPTAAFLDMTRIVTGVAIGLTSVTAPVYLAEMSPAGRRGSLVALYQLAITIGILVAYLVDLALSSGERWRAMFAIGVIPALALAYGLTKLTDTPRWLIRVGRRDDALAVLARIPLDGETPAHAADGIEEAMARERSGGLRDLVQRRYRLVVTIGVGLAIVQQITGINTVIYYAPTIFQEAGLEGDGAAITASVVVNVVNVLATFIAIRYLDRWGRRPLLLVGMFGMASSLTLLAIGFAVGTGAVVTAITIASLVCYIAAFAFSLGPIVWVMISEIYPLRVRAPGASLATFANWLFNLIVALSFLTMIDALGGAGTFGLFAGITFLSIVWVAFVVPETKGRTLEELEAQLVHVPPATGTPAPAPA